MKERVTANAMIGIAIVTLSGFAVPALAQQNDGITNVISVTTRVERAKYRQDFDKGPILSKSLLLPYLEGVEKFKAKDYDTAEQSFRKVLAYKPRHAKANYYLGAILARQGEDKHAIRHYKKSLKAYKTNPVILAKLGISYAHINKQEKANSILASLRQKANSCNNNCSDSKMITGAIHVLSEAIYNL